MVEISVESQEQIDDRVAKWPWACVPRRSGVGGNVGIEGRLIRDYTRSRSPKGSILRRTMR